MRGSRCQDRSAVIPNASGNVVYRAVDPTAAQIQSELARGERAMNGLLTFAFGAGMLSTVNPCGFALLPPFLAYYLGLDKASAGTAADAPGLARRAVNGLGAGALVSLGFAGVFTLTGLLVAIGLRSIIGAVPWVAVIIGVLLAVLGIAMVAGRHIGLTLGNHRVTRTG